MFRVPSECKECGEGRTVEKGFINGDGVHARCKRCIKCGEGRTVEKGRIDIDNVHKCCRTCRICGEEWTKEKGTVCSFGLSGSGRDVNGYFAHMNCRVCKHCGDNVLKGQKDYFDADADSLTDIVFYHRECWNCESGNFGMCERCLSNVYG